MFRYYESARAPKPGDDQYVAVVPAGLAATDRLMVALGEALRFPDYYGKNLDAFWDCVRVLDGIGPRRVALVHGDLPSLPRGEMLVYLGLLRDAVLHWRARAAAHRFDVYFPKALKPKINSLLKALPVPEE